MGQDLAKVAGETVHRAEVVFHGEKIILPTGMVIPTAITVLQQRLEYMKQKIQLSETFDVFPWDGARALSEVLKKRFGWTSIEGHPGMFGPQPPKFIQIEVGPGEVGSIPWGVFSLPGTDAAMSCSTHNKDGKVLFKVEASLLRNDEEFVKGILADLREYLKHHSIYRGKAIKLRLTHDNGTPLPLAEPKFIDTSVVDRAQLILSEEILASVETNLFTPITRVRDLVANDLDIKRGVLLGGTYGTGKTLAARVAAKLAVDNGVTFIYIARADELARAIQFAQQYQDPAAVVFCEDIDREMTGERTKKMDDILNIVDGLDSKSNRIIIVLTTNDLEKINPAMLRPGRLDAVIEVSPPDAKAVEKLLRYYGGDSIPGHTNLQAVGQELSGCIPAVISEVVKRAKLAQLKVQPKGSLLNTISAEALLESARTMKRQLQLLEPKPVETPDPYEAILDKAIKKGLNGGGALDTLRDQVIEGVAERLQG